MARATSRFKVWHMTGSTDEPNQMHFAIKGPTIDQTFAHGNAIARLIEDTLNAAYSAFVQK